MLSRTISFFDQLNKPTAVRIVIEQDTSTGLAVSASPPTLLVVVGDGLGNREVNDKANIGLVDAHTKRHGGADYLRSWCSITSGRA